MPFDLKGRGCRAELASEAEIHFIASSGLNPYL